MKQLIICCLLLAQQVCGQSRMPAGYVTTQGMRFTDSTGRELVLHGLNFVNKDRAKGYHYDDDSLSIARMRSWGMNCMRLGVSWDAMEPALGVINEQYLQKLDRRVQWAREQGMYVLLDMHQDLYSCKYGNGAPGWATLDEGKPHYANDVSWDDSYFMSAAVQTAFDNFWLNRPAADGKGVQDHLVNNWRLVARRYAGEPAVIGFDLMNEPFIGSDVQQVLGAFIRTLAGALPPAANGAAPGDEAVMNLWLSEEGKAQMMQHLNDTALYKRMIDATEQYYARFEKERLLPYYRKVAAAIRSVNPHHIIFLEPSVSANFGVRTHLRHYFETGAPAANIAFAPHAYDIVTDTRSVAGASNERVHIIFHRLDSARRAMNVPMLLGEWGAFYGAGSSVIPAGEEIVRHLERLRCGELYWSYFHSLDSMAYFPLINRGYPAAVAGRLQQYAFDRKKGVLAVEWEETGNIKAPTVLYVPFAAKEVQVQGLERHAYTVRPLQGHSGAEVVIKVGRQAKVRKVLVRRRSGG